MKILLPIDGSELALEAARHVLHLLGEGLRATFVLANVQEPTNLYERVVALDTEVFERVSEAAGTHALESAEALFKAAGMPYEREIASGDPAHTLIDITERYGCEAIIIGAHGRGALRGALLGSVSQAVLHNARVPVTIVKRAETELAPGADE